MVDDDYRRAVESAYKELARENTNPARAGQIAERAGIDDASRLGMLLSFTDLGFEEIGIEIIEYEDDDVSNEYRIRR